MSALELDPFAASQAWAAPHPLAPEAWAALFAGYLRRLAALCEAAGPCVIGHIKLLALFEEQRYLRVSAVGAAYPPTVTGAAPPGLSRIATTLNVLVYGLPRDELARLAAAAAAEVASAGGVACIDETPAHPGGDHFEGKHHVH